MTKHFASRVAALFLGCCTLSSLATDFTMDQLSAMAEPSTRLQANTTYFGWDNFEDPAPGTFLNDTTPDIGDTGIAGVRFETTNGQLHRAASTGNFYSGSSSATAEIAERVTVATNGTVGAEGTTTIIAQLVASSGNFISQWTFENINDVAPQVIHGVNALGRGQVWVKWVVPGNAATYEFTIGGVPHAMFGNAHMSFDKIAIDTYWGPEAQEDTMILEEPAAIAFNLDQATGIVAPSSRGTAGTTWFGWDGFGTPGVTAPIDDSTPDIGNYAGTQARFRTTNSEIHQFAGGSNLYILSGTLAEEITVPTSGVVGEAGFTTIFLQIASATSGMGGGSFAGEITATIDDVPPTMVVQGGAANTAQYWAKWEIPGNEATYVIAISGPEGQAHFSFDKVVVDTKFSPYGYVADSMKLKTVEITTETLADAVKGQLYNVQLEAEGGTLPHSWSLADESELPAGLTLSSSGVISGTPTTLEEVTFTVIAQDAEEYEAEKTYTLAVVSGIEIVTAELPVGVIGREYSVQLEAVDGLAPYEWSVTEGTLPAGLTLSAAGLLTGTPTAETTASLTFTVTDAEESTQSRVIELTVSPSLLLPVMNPVAFGATTVGADFAYTVSAANYPKQFNVSGLPAGLKVDRATGIISGRASLAGVYLVQVSAANTTGTSAVVSAPLVVTALPATQVGTFTGLIARDATANAGLGSQFTLTTTGKGSFTVKVKSGSATKSAKGFLASAAPQVQVAVNGIDLALTLDAETGLVSGTYGAAAVNGWLNVWDKKLNPPSSREGFYSVILDLADEDDLGAAAIPQGVGYATFTILPAGTVKIIGKSADGQTLTSSTTMGPHGELALYATQYANKGTMLGTLTVDEDEDGLFMGNDVSGSLTWLKPAGKGRVYAAGFGPVDLVAEGGYLGTATKRPVVLGLPATGSFSMAFEGAGVEASATNPDVTGALWTEKYKADFSDAVNAGKVTLKVNKATGAVTGSLTLTETTPPLVRKGVKFMGQVVRMSDGQIKAAGYFLLPQIATDGQKPNATPILSGVFQISQPLVP
ncbi:Ig domain-containing protein [Prosthecobacter sp. SYSU 5D2]|uniref:Ig domain-containing protein n=1 Tax=Prosthecobacter sp. SYSU 5D2 TaxID=3134134 RepID=UPI0031FEF661